MDIVNDTSSVRLESKYLTENLFSKAESFKKSSPPPMIKIQFDSSYINTSCRSQRRRCFSG